MSEYLLVKNYDGESVCDIDRDVSESIDATMNGIAAKIPTDKHGIQEGEFKVTIQWIPKGECWCTGFDHNPKCHNHWTNRADGEVPY